MSLHITPMATHLLKEKCVDSEAETLVDYLIFLAQDHNYEWHISAQVFIGGLSIECCKNGVSCSKLYVNDFLLGHGKTVNVVREAVHKILDTVRSRD